MPRTRSTLMGSASAALLLSLAAGSAHGQVREWAAPVNGSWTDAANWTGMDVPDMPGESALIDVLGTYTITLPSSFDPIIDNLSLLEPNAQLDMQGGAVIRVASGVTNDGLIFLNSNNSTSNAALQFDVSGVLGGSGVLRLGRGFTGDSRILTDTGATITHAATHTITGAGEILAAMVNNGSIVADAATFGQHMDLLGAPKVNNGDIRATSTGSLRILSVDIDNTHGTITADGGPVQLSSGQTASIDGGLIATTGAGVFTLGGSSNLTLTDVTLDGDVRMLGGSDMLIEGSGLTNEGLLSVNSNNSTSNVEFRFVDSGTLGGSGELRLGRGFSGDAQITTAPGETITHAATHTITGAGDISASMINNGSIIADLATFGQNLDLFGDPKVNNGDIRAVITGSLRLLTVDIDNTNGTITAEDGPIEVASSQTANIDGGLVATTGSGVFTVGASANLGLTDVTLDGDIRTLGGSDMLIDGSGVTNNGVITLNSNNSTSDVVFRFDQSGTLDGTGEIIMARGFFDTRIQTAPGETITHAATHTITGGGLIEASLINNGLIVANLSTFNQTLDLVGESKFNNAVIRADPMATLRVLTDVEQSATGQIVADGGTITVPTSTTAGVDGGLIDVTAGLLLLDSGAILEVEDVTLQGQADMRGGANIAVLEDGFTNDGLIIVNANQSTSNVLLRFAEPGTVGGTGTVRLNRSFGDAQITSDPGITGTVGPDQTVDGSGRFDGDIVLQGTLAPGFPGVDETTTKDHFGTLTFAPMHTFECDIENTPIAFFDRLVGNGDVNLAGTLEVDQLNGYVPMLGNEFQIITAGSVTGRFDTVVAPALPAPLVWKVIYRPTIVSLHATCPADITTDGTSDGVPDGAVTLSDFSFYLSLWSAGNPDADVTTDGSSNGIPDGAVTLSDFSFYLSQWSSGCP